MTFIVNAIYTFLVKIPRAGDWLSRTYLKFHNPVNYAIVGGVGVLINFVMWQFCLLLETPWFINNLFAILCAWLWNWSNSVGPLGYLWGFSKRP